MKIAVIGAGFAGLATCFHLLNAKFTKSVTLFDKEGIAAGASGVAAGLLHPYSGPRSKKSWHADVALHEAKELLKASSTRKPIAQFHGILRPCTTEVHHATYAEINEPDIEHWDAAKVQHHNPHLKAQPALFITSGIAVHTKEYLQELFEVCLTKGLHFEKRLISNTQELDCFDQVIVCAGHDVKEFSEAKELELSYLKGQLLVLEANQALSHFPCPVNSEGYLVLHPSEKTFFAGSTFERGFTATQADRAFAEREIRKKISAFSDIYGNLPFISCEVGIRAYTKNKLPLIARASQKTWIVTGLGSKGLLYHAWLGKLLAKAIETEESTHIPAEIYSEGVAKLSLCQKFDDFIS
jgi:glycine/D-amino acid oxidase-like deaminating enzyme